MGSIQRGAMVAQNDNGSLERVDGTGTYIGTATTQNGKVLTKRFRSQSRDEAEVTQRWLTWQSKQNGNEEEEMAFCNDNNKKTRKCPFSGIDCEPTCPIYSEANRECALKLGGIGVFNIATNYLKLDNNESLELIAFALSELKTTAVQNVGEKQPARSDGIDEFLEGKTFLSFVNLHSKGVYSSYKKLCSEKDFSPVKEKELIRAIDGRFPELEAHGQAGGAVFLAA